jgi:hypothetical protein
VKFHTMLMTRWMQMKFVRLAEGVLLKGRRSAQSLRVLGRAGPGCSKLNLLTIADAVGATLQINLIRPLKAATFDGAIQVFIFTEEDEQSEFKSGVAQADLVDRIWQESQPDALFISRYGGSLADAILWKAKQCLTPVIYHIDDNLFEVPEEAGPAKFRKYGSAERQAAMKKLLQGANVNYVSTRRLADQLSERNVLGTNVFIGEIASASDPISPQRRARSNGLRLGYMASSSHAPDLQLALPGIRAALTQFPGLRFTVFGSLRPPAELESYGARVEHVPAVGDYDGFLRQLAEMGWDWGLAPLRAGRFNEAKTDTKWVEYAAAGIPCLVSDHPVYSRCSEKDAAVAVSDQAWGTVVPRVLADVDFTNRTRAAAYERLLRFYGQRHMTSQLLDVLSCAGLMADQLRRVAERS